MSDRRAATSPIAVALALSLGAAVSLGITRFAYGLLLPPMRADLGWSYAVAGAMNTANTAGYFVGALMTPLLFARLPAATLFLCGALVAALFMMLSGFATDTLLLIGQRLIAGIASAWTFVAGGVLAARWGALHPGRAGLLLGIYYGGAGIGIVLCALGVPLVLNLAGHAGLPHAWQLAWIALGMACVAAAWFMRDARRVPQAPTTLTHSRPVALKSMAAGLAAYVMFGMGYIGYMTFVVARLGELGLSGGAITAFYALLGMGVIASSALWARMLDHFKGGESLAILNALCAIATLIPAVVPASPMGVIAIFASGLLFGSVFLSVVASTTMLVRHNLPPQSWARGISAFTTIFAAGQIIGPTIVGWISDGPGGLRLGLMISAGMLLLGALFATRQRAFGLPHDAAGSSA